MGEGLQGQVALVTGACGFLGSHVVRALAARGCAVHLLVRETSDMRALDGVPGLPRWTGDITDREALLRCCEAVPANAIFHLAGDPSARRFAGDWTQVDRSIAVNLVGTLNLVEAASACGSQLQTLVRVGGLEEYGSAPPPFRESQREAPRSPYSASQVAATHFIQALQPHLPFAAITLRPTLIYGPRQSEDFMIPALIRALLDGRRFPMSDGVQTRDLMHVDDFAAAAIACIDRADLRGAVLNIATGEAPAIRDVAQRIAAIVGRPELLDLGALPGRPGDIMDLRGDASEAEARLGWSPRISLDEGLAGLVAWYRAQPAVAA